MPDRIPVYVRVSSSDQVDGTSLDTQRRECAAAVERAGFAPGQVFEDAGESAKTTDRPQFLALLDYLDKHRPPAVCVWKLDRLARNTLDSAMFRHRLRLLGVRLISATESIGDDASGKFIADVLSAAAEYDNELRAARAKAGLRARATAGAWVNSPPLGYVQSRTTDGAPTMVPDADRARLVRRLFEEVGAGVSQAVAIEHATAAGLRTRRDKPLSPASVSVILANSAYAGWSRSSLAGAKPIRGNWEPIVPQATFDAVQVRLGTGRRSRRPGSEFPLRGLLICDKCEIVLTGFEAHGRSSRHRYYHCSRCRMSARADQVEPELHRILSGLAMAKPVLEVMRQHLVAAIQAEAPMGQDAKAAAKRELDLAEQALDRLVELRMADAISLDRYTAKYRQAEFRVVAARHALETANLDRIDLVGAFNAAEALLTRPGDFWRAASPSEQHAAFPLFFKGLVRVHPAKKNQTAHLSGLIQKVWLDGIELNQTVEVLAEWLHAVERAGIQVHIKEDTHAEVS